MFLFRIVDRNLEVTMLQRCRCNGWWRGAVGSMVDRFWQRLRFFFHFGFVAGQCWHQSRWCQHWYQTGEHVLLAWKVKIDKYFDCRHLCLELSSDLCSIKLHRGCIWPTRRKRGSSSSPSPSRRRTWAAFSTPTTSSQPSVKSRCRPQTPRTCRWGGSTLIIGLLFQLHNFTYYASCCGFTYSLFFIHTRVFAAFGRWTYCALGPNKVVEWKSACRQTWNLPFRCLNMGRLSGHSNALTWISCL